MSSLDVVAATSANDRCVEGRLHIAPVCDPLIQSVIRSVIPRSRDPASDPASDPACDPVFGGGLCDLVCASSFPPPQHAKERCCTRQKGRSRRKKEFTRSSHGDSGGALTCTFLQKGTFDNNTQNWQNNSLLSIMNSDFEISQI